MNQQSSYDVIIIGAGPAGLTASIYASRYKLKNIVIGKVLGGELSLASKIENLPGFVSIPGIEWGEKIKEQVVKLGANFVLKQVDKISKEENKFVVVSDEGPERFVGKTLIVATGSERRKLNIPGEKEYQGQGVSYCTSCDSPFFKDKTVALIGGADSAVSGAVHTAEFAKKVYIIYRRDKLRAEPIWIEEWQKIEKTGRGETIYNTNITRILGTQEFAKLKAQSSKLKATAQNLKLKEKKQLNNRTIEQFEQLESKPQDQVGAVELDNPYKGNKHLLVDGVFIEIGGVPASSLLKPLGVKLTEADFVRVNEGMETNIPGLYAAGDITDKSAVLVQAITAMAQGAIAAASCYKYLKGEKAPQILGT